MTIHFYIKSVVALFITVVAKLEIRFAGSSSFPSVGTLASRPTLGGYTDSLPVSSPPSA